MHLTAAIVALVASSLAQATNVVRSLSHPQKDIPLLPNPSHLTLSPEALSLSNFFLR